jgi:hypothetical protein
MSIIGFEQTWLRHAGQAGGVPNTPTRWGKVTALY